MLWWLKTSLVLYKDIGVKDVECSQYSYRTVVVGVVDDNIKDTPV
jgi:hypothetical protein